MPKILLWDIDGTLIRTNRTGIIAYQEAARQVFGRQSDLSGLDMAGRTDTAIAANILRSFGLDPEPDVITRLIRRYEALLPEYLVQLSGRVLPGVRAILERLQQRGDAVSLILTGNTRSAARTKLSHFGLDGYFSGGGYSDDAPDRETIACRARDAALALVPAAVPDDFLVIGDTPHDITCARHIGVRTIAVATGPSYRMSELVMYKPWWALEHLPAPTEFERKIFS